MVCRETLEGLLDLAALLDSLLHDKVSVMVNLQYDDVIR